MQMDYRRSTQRDRPKRQRSPTRTPPPPTTTATALVDRAKLMWAASALKQWWSELGKTTPQDVIDAANSITLRTLINVLTTNAYCRVSKKKLGILPTERACLLRCDHTWVLVSEDVFNELKRAVGVVTSSRRAAEIWRNTQRTRAQRRQPGCYRRYTLQTTKKT